MNELAHPPPEKRKLAGDGRPRQTKNGNNRDPMHLAAEINAEHELAYGKALQALEAMHRAGKLLLQAKETVGHGAWSTWLTENISFSERTAQNYMMVARHWTTLQAKSATVADLTLRQALTEIADKRPARITTISKRDYATATQEVAHQVDHGGGVDGAHQVPEADIQLQIYACLRDAWDEADAGTRRMFLLDDDIKVELLKLCRAAA